EVPEPAGDEALAVRSERHAAELLVLVRKRAQLLALGDVPDVDLLVDRGRGQHLAVLAHRDLVRPWIDIGAPPAFALEFRDSNRFAEAADFLARSGVPHMEEAITAGCQHFFALGREGDKRHPAAMAPVGRTKTADRSLGQLVAQEWFRWRRRFLRDQRRHAK